MDFIKPMRWVWNGEIKDTYNFNRSLRGAGIKSLKLHPGDALGLETVLMTRRKEVWGGGGRVHVITKPALHFSLSTWKHKQFYKMVLLGHSGHRGKCFSCALQNILEILPWPPIALGEFKILLFLWVLSSTGSSLQTGPTFARDLRSPTRLQTAYSCMLFPLPSPLMIAAYWQDREGNN